MRRRRPQGGRVLEVAWRHARAAKASRVAAENRRRRAAREADRFESKAIAWQAGYRVGFQRAYAYWRRWAQRAVAQRKVA